MTLWTVWVIIAIDLGCICISIIFIVKSARLMRRQKRLVDQFEQDLAQAIAHLEKATLSAKTPE